MIYIEKNSTQTLTGNSIFVTNSLFNAFSSSTQAGCISVTNSNCDFLIEETSFIEITISQNAVALEHNADVNISVCDKANVNSFEIIMISKCLISKLSTFLEESSD